MKLLVREWVHDANSYRLKRFYGRGEVTGALEGVCYSDLYVVIITWINAQKY